ncbi:hypothetical protein [Streptomyces diastatochromogenes]|uniref:hypothetical protein n=1 Tax=Streptomyces diastatochromogenes TaxID=42236 RepID=UPI0036ADAF76
MGHKDLEAVGKAAHDLFNDFTTYSGHARVASEAAAGGLKGEGFALGDALDHVTQRWNEQTKTLLDACAHISNHLRATQNQRAADDSYIAGTVSSIATLDEGFDDRGRARPTPCEPAQGRRRRSHPQFRQPGLGPEQ